MLFTIIFVALVLTGLLPSIIRPLTLAVFSALS